MNPTTRHLIHKVETLPPSMQQEVADFVEFLHQKATKTQPHRAIDTEPTGPKLAQIMEQIAARGTAFRDMEDPVAWQQEIRKDRPLPGRE